MAETLNKIQLLEFENKLFRTQQQNYKELCKILTQRHLEIVKYLNNIKSLIEKIISFSQENALYANYYADKSIYESNILKYDKQIQLLTDCIQSSQERISDNESNLLKEHLKLLSSSLVNLSSKPKTFSISNPNDLSQKFRCDYFDCSQEFLSKNLLDAHIQTNHHPNNNNANSQLQQQQNAISYQDLNTITNDCKLNEVFLVPQYDLEVLDGNSQQVGSNINFSNLVNQNNNSNSVSLSSSTTNDNKIQQQQPPQQPSTNVNGYKKLAACEYCGKYFNKHYLASHKRSHTMARPYKCSIDGCNRTFTQTSSRNVHEKRVHKTEKFGFKCGSINCGASFNNLSEIQKHIQQHHALINSMIASQQIDQINLVKPNNIVISNDNRSKTNKRTLKSGFIAQANNTNHSNNKNNESISNNNNLKHVCQHCGKAFAYKVAMRQHLALHGPKNFRCTFENCNYASFWKHNLGLHLKKHHNQNDSSTT